MKKTVRTLTVMVMVVLMLTIVTIPALATGFDFETATAKFNSTPLNTFALEVGKTHTPNAAVWAQQGQATCYSNNETVVTVSADGTVTAIGEGTAYVAINTGSMYELYCYNVSAKGKIETNNGTVGSNNGSKDKLNDVLNNNDGSGLGSLISDGFIVFIVGSVLFGIFFVLVVIWMIATARKSRKLDSAMQAIVANPCQDTAEAAVEEFSNMNALLRFNLANGSDTRGVHFTMWREVFNFTVIPCRNIKSETKEALRQALIRLKTHSLKPVFATQTPEEAKEAAEAFGKGGEDNVWHNLRFEMDCDLYRNVKIRNGDTCSEIDAILVSESKGIFLFEIKSVGGKTAPGGNKVIEYDQLREAPSNQIYRHENDFIKYFADIDIGKKIKNVLIFSWPHSDTRRMVAHNTFPKTDYAIITVEQLGEFFRMQSDNPITKAQRSAIAAKLKSCSGDSILRNV